MKKKEPKYPLRSRTYKNRIAIVSIIIQPPTPRPAQHRVFPNRLLYISRHVFVCVSVCLSLSLSHSFLPPLTRLCSSRRACVEFSY